MGRPFLLYNTGMITLNDYLYNGDTLLKIILQYATDLRLNGKERENEIDVVHADFLMGMRNLLIHNDFLTSQSQRIRDFYKHMAETYPFLAFTFKGRIKSLIRTEEKFNGYIVECIYDYYLEHGSYPSVEELEKRVSRFHDLIAYRIVISLPQCNVRPGVDKQEQEIKYLYEIANQLPNFLEERDFVPQPAGIVEKTKSPLLNGNVKPYYRDYVTNLKGTGYRSLHITFLDSSSDNFMEVQLRTKDMDDFAEIGRANHESYERRQTRNRMRRDAIPAGENRYFDEAYERVQKLETLDLSGLDVNMFSAANNYLINDGCGLFRGRMILPYEHLSRFQNDLID